METIKILRSMEWERAKCSLRAIIASYTDMSEAGYIHRNELNDIIEAFIEKFKEQMD